MFCTYKRHVYALKADCYADKKPKNVCTMAEKKEKKDLLVQEKKKSWTYKELVVATGGGEL